MDELVRFFESFNDPTLMILIGAAVVSLVIGIVEEGAAKGWIEGGAILIAVLLVASVTAGNDYTKELQFRELEKSSDALPLVLHLAPKIWSLKAIIVCFSVRRTLS